MPSNVRSRHMQDKGGYIQCNLNCDRLAITAKAHSLLGLKCALQLLEFLQLVFALLNFLGTVPLSFAWSIFFRLFRAICKAFRGSSRKCTV